MCYTLEEIEEKAVPIAKSYGIQSLSIFGSYARHEAHTDSDIDICIDKGNLRNLIQYFSFIEELEKAFQCHVDVVTTEIEDQDFLKRLLEERILLYERQG
ncbi:MAG: nucleotidyltransferase domain-containing protein [Roseburia sp.]|nr:nucleotidyltransferase domain-containing protein [Roseburia sp.]